MARIARLSGAIVAHTGDDYYLIGSTKEPCQWESWGFVAPAEREPVEPFWQRLEVAGPVTLPEAALVLDLEGEPLAARLSEMFIVRRNGSVSERLWNLVQSASKDGAAGPGGEADTRWVGTVPKGVWDIVRDAVLRCT